MDWGLFRSSKRETYGLRDQIKFPWYFYYFAIVLNLLLRFFWVLSIGLWAFENEPDNIMNYFEILAFMSLMAEAIRRSVWSLIRVENEFFNNFEAYRTIPNIPDLMGNMENIDRERVKQMI